MNESNNLPDNWDEERFEKAWGSEFTKCKDCEYYRCLRNGERVVELCVADDVDFIPDEGGCEQ